MHTKIWKQQCWNKTARGFYKGRPLVPRHSYERGTVDGIFNELLSRSADCIGIGLHGMKKDCPPTDSAAALKILLGNKRDQAKNMWHLKSSRWLLQCKQIEIIQIFWGFFDSHDSSQTFPSTDPAMIAMIALAPFKIFESSESSVAAPSARCKQSASAWPSACRSPLHADRLNQCAGAFENCCSEKLDSHTAGKSVRLS